MLGLDNPIHIAFILILLLLVFGAKRLPEMGKSLGAGLRGFKDSISGEDHLSQIHAEHDPVRAEHDPVRVDDPRPVTADRPVAPTPERVVEPAAEHGPVQPVA